MSLRVYNTLSRSLEEFIPADPQNVKMYACGITVYDEAHIGHASQAVFFDIMRSYLQFRGFKVTYVRNFTDIDDKIIHKANEIGKTASEISEYFIDETRMDLEKIKVRPADIEPRVTDHIDDIIEFIRGLIERGFAYESSGDVLFAVGKIAGYGKLSNRKIEDLSASEPSNGKKHPADFALWKAAKQGEPFWISPWGSGRPGWHIECSVLARKYLGDTLDIHGGGIDLLFPHHENEIAQSESLTGKPLSKYWIHNGLVMVNNQKMSKSLGNFYTIKESLEKFDPDVIRYIILSHHYSSKIDFSENAFRIAEKRVFYFCKTLLSAIRFLEKENVDLKNDHRLEEGKLIDGFKSAMDENFNTARVIAELSSAFNDLNKLIEEKKETREKKIRQIMSFLSDFETISKVLRFIDSKPEETVENIKNKYLKRLSFDPEILKEKIYKRIQFKKSKDFISADTIRNDLLKHGIRLLDYADRTEWEIPVGRE